MFCNTVLQIQYDLAKLTSNWEYGINNIAFGFDFFFLYGIIYFEYDIFEIGF